MSKIRHVKEIILLTLFLLSSFAVGIVSFLSSNQQTRNTTSAQASSNVDQSCRNGVYYVKDPNNTSKEISCGRGVCGGVSYTGTASINWESAGKCWKGNSDCGPACQGLIPLCCYKMAETGDAEDCPFPERKYCRQDQCKKQTKNNDSNCGSGIGTYCVDIPNCLNDKDDVPMLSLDDRLAGKKTPSGSNTNPPTNTPPPPTQTPTKQPNTPTTAPAQATPTTKQSNPIMTITPINNSPTPIVREPSPTSSDTYAFDFGNNQNNQPEPTQNVNNQENTSTPQNNNQPIAFSLPQIEIKSPKQILRETINQPTVEKMNKATEMPLGVAKTGFITVRSYDQQLEQTVEGWLFKARVSISNLFK